MFRGCKDAPKTASKVPLIVLGVTVSLQSLEEFARTIQLEVRSLELCLTFMKKEVSP